MLCTALTDRYRARTAYVSWWCNAGGVHGVGVVCCLVSCVRSSMGNFPP